MSRPARPAEGLGGGADSGQALLPVAFVLALVVVSALAVVLTAGIATDRARARTAADAGALVAVGRGVAAVDEVVERNGGRTVSVTTTDDWVEVTVSVGRATATARAEAVTPGLSPVP